jgi:broad specificity phosphatase PhoE
MKFLAAFQRKAARLDTSRVSFSSFSRFSTVAPFVESAFLYTEEKGHYPKISNVLPPLEDSKRRIYLLRHGETDWNAQGKIQGGGFDIPLNENGRSQASAAARAMEDIPLSLIASSPLSRAKETADILWEGHSTCERILVPHFKEFSFGEFEGFPRRCPDVDPERKERYLKIDNECNQNVHKAFPGGESAAKVAKRANIGLSKLLDEFREHRHVAIVCHSRLNRILISSAFMKDVNRFSSVMQGNTCINAIDICEKGEGDIQLLNFIDHVKDNLAPDSNV